MAAGDASATDGAQTPRELLESLRRISDEARPDPEFLKKVAESTAERFGLPEAMQVTEDTGDAHFMKRMHALLETFQPDIRARLFDERNCLIGRIWTRDVNAHALRADNGGWLIVINEGLVAFVYKFLRALMLRVRAADPTQERPPGGPTLYGANMIAINLDWYGTTGFAAGPDFPVTTEQVQMASGFATAAENFVIAHELAHQMLDHPAHSPRSMLVNGTQVQAEATSFADEHEADTWGVRFILDSLRGQEGAAFAIAYAGVEAFFAAVSVLEEFVGAPPFDTHPPAADRLAEVREFTRQIVDPNGLPSLTRLSTELNEWVDAVRGELASLEHPSVVPTIERSPQERRTQFERLLDAAMSDSMADVWGPIAESVKWRMWDIPAETFCQLTAARFARAYEQRNTTAVAELIGNLLPTGLLLRAIDERLPIPFLHEVGQQLAAHQTGGGSGEPPLPSP